MKVDRCIRITSRLGMKNIILCMAGVGLVCTSAQVAAQTYKCKNQAGKISYSNLPCADETVTVKILESWSADASEWTAVSKTGSFVAYVNPHEIHKQGEIAKMWTMTDYSTQQLFEGKVYLSAKTLWEFDCKNARMRGAEYTWFSQNMGVGNVVFSDSASGQWTALAPDTIGESEWEIACGKR